MGNYELLKAAINEVIKANGRQEITGEVLNQVLLSMVNSLGAGYQCMGVATPSTNPGTPDQNVFYFATQAGTYTNFNAIVLQAGISVLIWDGDWASQTWFTVDSAPTNNSQNLIASGAVFNALKLDGGAYDVSAHNSGATFASLSALLNSANLNTLIPTEIRHGGMSIKFAQSSDNKYVQYRLTANEWTTDTNDWAIYSESVYVENSEFVYVYTDKDNKILWAIKRDGGIYYGAGVPKQVIDYIEEKIADLSLDEYEDIVTFLSDYLGGDTTLKSIIDNLANTKVDKVAGKSLIDADYASSQSAIDNPEFLEVTTDSEDKILEAITTKGRKQINLPIDTPSVSIEYIEDPEWLEVTTDSEGRIIHGTRKDGTSFPVNNTKTESSCSWEDIEDKPDFSAVAESGDYADLLNKPNLSQVSISGSYADLKDKPTALNPEGSVVVDAALDATSENMVKNNAIAKALKVSTIETLKSAISSGYKFINFDTNGIFVELSEKIIIPEGTTIYAYNAFVKRAVGFDTTLIEMKANSHLFGLTIDGNRTSVVAKYWATAIEIATSTQEKETSDINLPGATIKDCHFIHGNCCIMYYGWHNLVENCSFEDCGSAAIHFSSCYHSTVRKCFFKQCCQESRTYKHSEGAILWSNWTCYSLIEDNYFVDCIEAALGGLDTGDNCCNQIINNKMVHTGGIAGDFAGGNAPHSLIIRDNIIIDSKFGEQSDYHELGEKSGIVFRRSPREHDTVSSFVLNNVTINNNYLYNSCLVLDGATNAVITDNRIFYLKKNEVDSAIELILANAKIDNNMFVNANTNGNKLKLQTCNLCNNILVGRGNDLYLQDSHNVIISNNFIAHNGDLANWWNNDKSSSKIDLLNNIISLVGVQQRCKLCDWSNVHNNYFIGSKELDSTYNTIEVEQSSLYVSVRNNYYVANVSLNGPSSCINEGNIKLQNNPSDLIGEATFNIINATNDLAEIGEDANYYAGLPLFFFIIPMDGYSLPDTITITTNYNGVTKTLMAGDWNSKRNYSEYDKNNLSWTDFKDYIYDKNSGLVFIPVAFTNLQITGHAK